MSLFTSIQFFIMYLTNFMCNPAFHLHWWWFEDEIACSVFNLLQKCFELVWNRISACVRNIFLSRPYSAKQTSNILGGILFIGCLHGSLWRICWNSLQYTRNVCLSFVIYLNQWLPMACPVSIMVSAGLWIVTSQIQV